MKGPCTLLNHVAVVCLSLVKLNSSLPRSSRQTPSHHMTAVTVPDTTAPSSSSAQLPPTPGKSKSSMLDKFKLFGTKGRPDKENVSSDQVDVTSKTAIDVVDAPPASECGRVPRLPVRNRREVECSQHHQGPLTETIKNNVDGTSGTSQFGSLPPGGSKTASNTPPKTSKVCGRNVACSKRPI